jgi:hypothetical protein
LLENERCLLEIKSWHVNRLMIETPASKQDFHSLEILTSDMLVNQLFEFHHDAQKG